MRRIKIQNSSSLNGKPAWVQIDSRDYRLMRAVVRAAEKELAGPRGVGVDLYDAIVLLNRKARKCAT